MRRTTPAWLLAGFGVVLLWAACEPPPGFSPSPESYTESTVTIDGVSGERTIAAVEPGFFGPHRPLLGRLFVADDYGDASPVAILSHPFWTERFAARPESIGSSLQVGDTAYVIVGVMPEGFDVPQNVALWIPRVSGTLNRVP